MGQTSRNTCSLSNSFNDERGSAFGFHQGQTVFKQGQYEANKNNQTYASTQIASVLFGSSPLIVVFSVSYLPHCDAV